MATPARPKVFKNFINGEWVEARSGKAIENRNPANTENWWGMFPASTEEDVNLAIDAAKGAYEKWRLTPAPKRAEILYRAAEILIERKEDYSRDMTREMGKVLGGNARRCAGSDRHDLPDGGGGKAAVWADDAFGTAE